MLNLGSHFLERIVRKFHSLMSRENPGHDIPGNIVEIAARVTMKAIRIAK